MATYWSDMCHRTTAVYRAYNAAGALLYIGVSCSPTGRFAKHRHKKPWWKTDVTDIYLTWYPDRQSALDAERTAIREEKPRYNIVVVNA